ncbi:hypothetical protein EMPS_04133 [Entomortierella parvispora]|uniref:SH3 domain-containing protein n=1 Tax=Entomortierella parvispora TaxID=205924 RepID=A0A9P3H822_9FUNG|nr:hypothetical protein EMPS_04133 [Entomortierella parvispora]
MAMAIPNSGDAEDFHQLFQWPGGDVKAVQAEFDPETGKNVVFFQDILPPSYQGNVYIQDDMKIVRCLKDKSRKLLEPLRIECVPNKVLKVVPFEHPVVEHSASDSTAVAVSLSNQNALGPVAESATQPMRASMNGQLLVDIAHGVKEVIDTQHKNHAETVDMMKTTHNWLALILDRANAIFRLTYELHEYPIPRLFVILPGRNSFTDRLNPLVDKYRLYFLCECDLSVSGNGGRSQPHIHFAKHDGYDLERPTEFFKKYGPYILTLLQLLRFSVSAGSFAVPHIAGIGKGLQKGIEEFESAAKDQLKQKVDEAIVFLKDLPTRNQVETGNDVDSLNYDVEKIEALEGADLRHLASFLKTRDETQVLGNLYRLARPDGTIKWVCLDHYREEYKAIDRKHFMEFVDTNNGTYYSNEGKVEIRLSSKQMASQFYQQLVKARFVHELVVTLDWYTTLDDFKDFKAVMSSLPTILSLTVDCCNTQSRLRDLVTRGTPSSVLHKIMAGLGLQSFSIRNCSEFLSQVEKLNLHNQLRKIDVGAGIEGRTQMNLISSLIKKSPRLRHLIIQLPDLPSALLLYAKADRYQFKGASVLEARVETGEILTGEIQGNSFADISLSTMDCTKDIAALSFITKLATAINVTSDMDHLAQFLSKAKDLKEIILQVEAGRFFDARGSIVENGKGIRRSYFHDKDKNNILIMSDIRDLSTAEIDLVDDSSDFDRLLDVFGAAPRSCGKSVALTNDIFARLERNTRKISRINFLQMDISILDDKGVDNAILVIQRSALEELSIQVSTRLKTFSADSSLLWRLIKEVTPKLKDALLDVHCLEGQICQFFKSIRSFVSSDMGGRLQLSDGVNSIFLTDIQDNETADISICNDNLDIPVEEFYEMFRCLPSMLGVYTLISDSVISFLDKLIQPEDTNLKSLTVDPRILRRDAKDLTIDIIGRCTLDSLDVQYYKDDVDFIVQMARNLRNGKLTLHCTTELIPTNLEYLRVALSSDGTERCLRLTDEANTIIFDNVCVAQFRLHNNWTSTTGNEFFSVDEAVSEAQVSITSEMLDRMEQWTRVFPSTYKQISVDTSELNTINVGDMIHVISRSKLSSLTVFCSNGSQMKKELRNLFLLRVLPYLVSSKLYIHCPVKEFAELWQLTRVFESQDESKWEHHLCDGQRSLDILPNAPPKLILRGPRATHHNDIPLDYFDFSNDLGDTLFDLGDYVEHLDTESVLLSEKDAALWCERVSSKPPSSLRTLRLSSTSLTERVFDSLRQILVRSHHLTHFAFVCECNETIPEVVVSMLQQNNGIIHELVLRGSEIEKWIQELATSFSDRDVFPVMTSLRIALDGQILGRDAASWMFSMRRLILTPPKLKILHLRNVNQSSMLWISFFQFLKGKSLEELDLSGSDVSEQDIFAANYWLEEPLKILNLKGTRVHSSSLDKIRSLARGRPLEILLNPPKVTMTAQDTTTKKGLESKAALEVQVTVRALYDFESEDVTNLALKEGDIIQVLAQLESGWWAGYCQGRQGWFPSNYVEIVKEDGEGNQDEEEGEEEEEKKAGEEQKATEAAVGPLMVVRRSRVV